jgi:diacylglycerol kinase (ATP)
VSGGWADAADRHLTLLVNPAAGNGRSRRHAEIVVERCRHAGAEVTVRTADSPDRLVELAHQAVADARRGIDAGQACAVVAVGGDGTVHLVLQAVGASGVPMGVVAAGSGDDAARAWGLPRAAPLSAADILLAGVPRAQDLPHARRADDHLVFFGTVVASGFDARVSERSLGLSAVPARLRYVVAMLAELRSFRPVRYQLTLDDRHLDLEAMLVAIANSASYGGGMRICPDARADDGLLDVLVLDPLSTTELLRVFPRVYAGTHVTHPAVSVHRVRRVHVDAADMLAFADGEPLARLPLQVTVQHEGLKVLAPLPRVDERQAQT